VSGWRDFGAFVDLGGADGLIHVSELAWHRVEHPREVVKMGEELDVYVLKIDHERERISLSRKRLLANPWTTVEENYAVGDLVEGRIIRIVDYGAFVEIEPGVEGLLHTSQIARSNVESPRDILQEGETHLLRIISIDAHRQRMGLSLKAVTATEQIEWMTHREQEVADSSQDEAVPDQAPPAASDGQVLDDVGHVDTVAVGDDQESIRGASIVSADDHQEGDSNRDLPTANVQTERTTT
jgi:ribosomal protein S1